VEGLSIGRWVGEDLPDESDSRDPSLMFPESIAKFVEEGTRSFATNLGEHLSP
jgi:hypothetical protein